MRIVVLVSQISRVPRFGRQYYGFTRLGSTQDGGWCTTTLGDKNLSLGLREELTWCKEKSEVLTTIYLSCRCNSAR